MTTLTILCENTAGPAQGVLGEHGFAALIERSGRTYLFDTGQGRTILHNAECLGKDLAHVEKIVLSHGHYDHTGGLAQAVGMAAPVDVFAHPDVFTERFVVLKTASDATYRSAGIPVQRADLESMGARFVFNTSFREIADGMYLTGEVPRICPFEKSDTRLALRHKGGYAQDAIVDDQSLVIETSRGLAVILGCAHAGVINILQHITAHMPGMHIHALIGGMHIGFLDQPQIDATIGHLQTYSPDRIGVSHCTGLAPSLKLLQAFGERFFFANAGSSIELV